MVAQHGGVVAGLVLRSIKQGHDTLACVIGNLPEEIVMPVELGQIAGAEVLPGLGIGMELAAQGVARGDVLAPFGQACAIPGDAARPEAIDEDPPAVRDARGPVDTLDADAVGRCFG
jgi:hypothetical protein